MKIKGSSSEKCAFFREIFVKQVIISVLLWIYRNDSNKGENGKKSHLQKQSRKLQSIQRQLLLDSLTHCHVSTFPWNIVLHVIKIFLHLCQVGNNCIPHQINRLISNWICSQNSLDWKIWRKKLITVEKEIFFLICLLSVWSAVDRNRKNSVIFLISSLFFWKYPNVTQKNLLNCIWIYWISIHCQLDIRISKATHEIFREKKKKKAVICSTYKKNACVWKQSSKQFDLFLICYYAIRCEDNNFTRMRSKRELLWSLNAWSVLCVWL